MSADGEMVERACSRCGEAVRMSVREPYVMHPWCDACLRDAQATQDRKMTEALRQKDPAA
jgi:hypothetical protein